MVTLDDVRNAHDRIKGIINKTPVLKSRTIDKMTEAKVFFKCENFQRVGAFKFRGAVNAVSQLSDEEKERGVIAHSSGNHAQALSLAASMLGVHATIVMPRTSPRVKMDATRGYGADIVLCEPTVQSRADTAQALVDEHGYVLVHPYNDPRIIAGAGTAALELIEEVGDLDYVFCPIGGGGLASGTSIALKGILPDAKMIACEPAGADDAYRSFMSGELVPSIDPDTIADGLLTSLGSLTFKIVQECVDDFAIVSDEEIVDAMRLYFERMKIVVEPSGAVSLAGLRKQDTQVKGSKVGVIISGGNIDMTAFFATMLEKYTE